MVRGETMKILQNGIAVIEGDTHISKWVEEAGTLSIADKYLAQFTKYIRSGSVVIDAGAMIGDHTSFYARHDVLVMAFEPNEEAFACLEHNMKNNGNVQCFPFGLSDVDENLQISRHKNAGASHILSGLSGSVHVEPLDGMEFKDVSFIKIDVEGFEVRVLRGGEKTIALSKPAMLIEVNAGALDRAGFSRDELLSIIRNFGYMYKITDSSLKYTEPQYDVICIPES